MDILKYLEITQLKELKKIFNMVDADKSGYIYFNEWVDARFNKKKLLTRDKLKANFS
jgi:hypothetical protein